MTKYLNKYYWIRKIIVNSFFSKFFSEKKLNQIVFNSIYKSNHWNKSKKFNSKNQSFSGPGSIPGSIQTDNLIEELSNFFKNNNIIKILDAPCGDCAWIQRMFNANIDYTGIDIVEDLINKNKINFQSFENVKFSCKDLTENNEFNNFDFILMRDFFIHLPIKSIEKILNNLKKSNCKYFAFNSYERVKTNVEISTGQHRKINILKEPFNFGKPYFKILEVKNENFTDESLKDNFIYIYKNNLFN